MKLTVGTVLCLSLVLAHFTFSMAGKGFGGKLNLFKKPKPPKQSNLPGKTNQPGSNPNRGGSPYQGGYHNQGSYNQGGYAQQPGYQAGGYPAQNYPYGGGHGGYGSYGHHGSYGSYGGYPGGYMNYNPNNRILSPHYGGSYGYGGHGFGGGSPFSRSAQAQGIFPSDKSRGFGRTAVMAAAGGAVAGMALGYGLGRFPRPHFQFHSPQEEYYYNHYMYRKYGVKSTDTNDYSRDYNYSPPPQTYDSFMDSCVKRKDLLPEEIRQQNKKPAATTTNTITITTTTAKTTTATAAPDAGIDNNATQSNNTAVDDSSTPASSTHPLNQPKVDPVSPASKVLQRTATDDVDDTVSIVEIGYPALIKQLKVRRCVELYIVYSEKYLKKKTKPSASNGVQGLEMGLQGLLAVVTSIMMALNSNMLLQQH